MCKCGKYNSTTPCNICDTNSCDPCNQDPCGCKFTVDAECVINNNNEFCAIQVKAGGTLADTLSWIDQYICELEEFAVLIENVGGGVELYKGTAVGGVEQFKTFFSSDSIKVDGTQVNTVSFYIDEEWLNDFIETNQKTYSVTNVGDGIGIYQTPDTVLGDNTTFRFKSLTSPDFIIEENEDETEVIISAPSSFTGVDYYVNANYTGDIQNGTQSRPYKTLENCIGRILNRVNPDPNVVSNDPLINGGNPYEKWELRTDQPFDGNIRVIIQSPTPAEENLAINRVTYFLERGGFESMIYIPATGSGGNLEYLIDMEELVQGIIDNNLLNPDGSLPYMVTTDVTGSGYIEINGNHVNRKGFFKSFGYNNGNISQEQNDCNLTIGSIGNYIHCAMFQNNNLPYIPIVDDIAHFYEASLTTSEDTFTIPLNAGTIEGTVGDAIFLDAPLHSVWQHDGSTWSELALTTDYTRVGNVVTLNTPANVGDSIAINYYTEDRQYTREGVLQTGVQLAESCEYGAIHVKGYNAQFRDSCFLNGNLQINHVEQPAIYLEKGGTLYSDNGLLYLRPHYQHICYKDIQYIAPNPNNIFPVFKKYYTPSDKLYHFHAKESGTVNYGGRVYTQENTGFNQGGMEAIFCVESLSDNSLPSNYYSKLQFNGGGIFQELWYNSYIKIIQDSSLENYQNGNVQLSGGFNINSVLFESVYKIVDENENDWTKFVTLGTYSNCIFKDYFNGTVIKKPVSNIAIPSLLSIDGNIKLYRSNFNMQLLSFANNLDAIAGGLSYGEIYKTSTGEIRVVV